MRWLSLCVNKNDYPPLLSVSNSICSLQFILRPHQSQSRYSRRFKIPFTPGMKSQDLWLAGNWKIKIWKGLINSTNRCYFFHKVRQKKKIKPRAWTILFFTCTQHSSEIQLFTWVDLTEVFEHCQYAVFCLCVFQITGEKRPSSEMMKPKPKPQKKKKKKDPNEPTKPVSAYALFFRDTQAAIKGQNPNATFGDVSKIVASMWDGLGEEQKQVLCIHSIDT